MQWLRFFALVVSLNLGFGYAGVGSAQNYPDKVVRILATSPGGGTDVGARLIAQGIAPPLGQPVVVENRAGLISMEAVAKAPPDGYNLLAAASAFWIGPLLQKVSYDSVKDFSPISMVSSTPNILVVHPSLPVKSVKELIAFAKARPGALNYASGAAGSSNHLSAELFKSMAGVDIVNVLYKGTAPALTDLISGRVQIMFGPASGLTSYIKSGKLKGLAVTSAGPSVLAPGFATVAGSGLPGYESAAMYGLLAPAGTPVAIISRLNQETVRVLNRADVKDKFLNAGLEVVASSPEQFAATMKAEIARWGKVIKAAGLSGEP